MFPYHVTARSNNREWFYLPSEIAWEICRYLFNVVTQKYEAQVLEFVLMSNHFHLLVATPQANLDRIMNYFMREFSRTVGAKTGRINHVFGGRYKGSIIRTATQFAHAYKYILRNPVAAKMVTRVEDYPFSTIGLQLNPRSEFPAISSLSHRLSRHIPLDLSQCLEWLNTAYDEDEAKLIRSALHRTEFSFPTHKRHRAVASNLDFEDRK